MLKFQEVYLKTVKEVAENPDGSTRVLPRKLYCSRDCLINPHYVVAVYEKEFTSSGDLKMLEGRFPEDTQYSRIILDGNSFRSSEIIIVGSFDKIEQRLK